jgi:hypothetical protein
MIDNKIEKPEVILLQAQIIHTSLKKRENLM